MSDSESEIESEKAKKKSKCEQCKALFANKYCLKNHLKNACPRIALNKCMWCGLRFNSRGILGTHAAKVHGDTSYLSQRAKSKAFYVKCSACNMAFSSRETLKFHIRRTHFNLRAPIASAEVKKVNQVWFEKALDNTIVEIKKAAPGKLVIKALKNTNIRINDITPEMVDVSHLYPINRGTVFCKLCNKPITKKDFKKHYSEKHLNRKLHQCNNCNRSFSRHYLYLRHVCSRIRKVRGVTKSGRETDIVVASVESLSIPLG